MKRHILLTFAICLTIIAECDVRVSLEEAQEKATAYYQKIDGNKKGMYKAIVQKRRNKAISEAVSTFDNEID